MLRLLYILKLNPYECCTVIPGIVFLTLGTMIIFITLMAWYLLSKQAEGMETRDKKAVEKLFIRKCSIRVLNWYSWAAILMIIYMTAEKAGDLYFLPDLFAIAFFFAYACAFHDIIYGGVYEIVGPIESVVEWKNNPDHPFNLSLIHI